MSTIKVNKIENTATADGGIAIDASGHVQVDGVQLPTAGPLSNRNLIINGAMLVAQRGTSATSGTYGSVDRFYVASSQGTRTQSQESLSSGSPYDEGFTKFFRATNTTPGGNNTSSFTALRQVIEDQNLANSGWNYKSSSSYVTLSFWVRSSVSQEFYTYLNFGTDEHLYTFSIGTLAANTWTKITKTVPGDSSLSLDNDNSGGLEITISPFWGTNFTTSGSTVDAWYTFNGSSRVPDMTTTWNTTSGATFDITGVQLEVGEKATPFEHRSYGDELARCQRYYYKIGPLPSQDYFGICEVESSTNSILFGEFPVTLRADPTAVEQTGTAGDYVVRSGGSSRTCSSVPALDVGTNKHVHATSFVVASGQTSGHAGFVRAANVTDAFLAWSAEL
jgi:hypothetical protein